MFTTTLDADNLGSPEPIQLPSDLGPGGATKLVIREQGGAATTGYRIRMPAVDSAYFEYLPGEPTPPLQKDSGFITDEVVGYIETLTGPATFSIIGY